MKKFIAMCAAAVMSAGLYGCGGAPSASEFEAKLKEYNSKIDVPMPDGLVKKSVDMYKNASSEGQQKQYDELIKKLDELGKKDKR